MWARVVEIMLAAWLFISPFVFRLENNEIFLWTNAFATGGLVALISLVSFWPKAEKLHLLNLGVGAWLLGVAFAWTDQPPPPELQNYTVLGLLLTMFAVIPSRSQLPPRPWREFYERRSPDDR